MSKRFIDTTIWDKAKFNEAPLKIKLLALFIFSKCDCIGMFRMAPVLVSAYIGEPITEEDILSIPADIEKLSDDTYWLVKFCDFQYGQLRESCKPHIKYIKELKNRGLYERVFKGYAKGIHTLEEQEQEKEEEKEEEKGECEGDGFALRQVEDYAQIAGLSSADADEFYHHFNAQGWRRGNGQEIKNLKSAMVYWRNHRHEFRRDGPPADPIEGLEAYRAKKKQYQEQK